MSNVVMANPKSENSNLRTDLSLFCLWYRCQFCSRSFQICEEFIDHKVRDHLQQFLLSTSQRKSKENEIEIPQAINTCQDSRETDGEKHEVKIPSNPAKRQCRFKMQSKIKLTDRNLIGKRISKLYKALNSNPASPAQFKLKSSWTLDSVKILERMGRGKSQFQCRFCSRVYSTRSNCFDHEGKHLRKWNYQCQFCGRTFVWTAHYRKHELICRRRSKIDLPTPAVPVLVSAAVDFKSSISPSGQKIQLISDTKQNTADQIRTVSVLSNYCTSKSLPFTSPEEQAATIKVVRKFGNLRGFECRFCRKVYLNKICCIEHESLHLGHRLHKCGLCSKTFTWTNDFRKHQRRCEVIHNLSNTNASLSLQASPPETEKMHVQKLNCKSTSQTAITITTATEEVISESGPQHTENSIVEEILPVPLQVISSNCESAIVKIETETGDSISPEMQQETVSSFIIAKQEKKNLLEKFQMKSILEQIPHKVIAKKNSRGNQKQNPMIKRSEDMASATRKRVIKSIRVKLSEGADLVFVCKTCNKISPSRVTAKQHCMVHRPQI